jgi:hypothetical protein
MPWPRAKALKGVFIHGLIPSARTLQRGAGFANANKHNSLGKLRTFTGVAKALLFGCPPSQNYEDDMDRYDFKLRFPDGLVSVVRSVELPGMAAVWATVADIAQGVEQVDARIIVTNENGDVLIFAGLATARDYPHAKSQAQKQATPSFAMQPPGLPPLPAPTQLRLWA